MKEPLPMKNSNQPYGPTEKDIVMRYNTGGEKWGEIHQRKPSLSTKRERRVPREREGKT